MTREERLLRDVEIEHARAAGLDVITDEEGQKVLDLANEGVKLSKSFSKRKQWINDYVEAVSLATRRDKKEIRAELMQKMAEVKRDAKDLYEKVLAGDFNEVTLR